ncbi:MAG: uroporphyrinogen decarboxylase family protein [Planctomycetota bacterium]
MAYPGVKDDFLACSEGRAPSRMPVLSLGLEFHLRRANVTDREARLDVEKMVACQVQAVRDYSEDWAAIFPDDYVEFEPLGLEMRDDENHPTMPVAYLPFTPETLARFRIPDPHKEMRLPIHLEMLRRLKAELGDRVLVMGRIAAPFSALGLVYGIEELMIGLMTQPDLVKDNARFFVDHQIAFGKAQLKAGADLLWLGDCCADSAFLKADHFSEFAFEPAAQTAQALKATGGLLIYHTSETSLAHLSRQVQLPVHAVNCGEGCSVAEAKRRLEPDLCLMGNFDPILLRDGSPEEVAEATERMIRENLPGGRYIFNTGEGVMQNSPPANVAAMLEAAKALAPRAGELV